MWRLRFLSVLCCLAAAASPADAATGRVIKVLPHFLDLKGRHALSPSLFERDAYQAQLRRHPEQRSGMRFDIQWKSRAELYAPLKIRVELRGAAKGGLPGGLMLEKEVEPGGWFSHWTSVALTGEDYRRLGEITAWRVTLWEGDEMRDQQESFLW